jgi:E-phenylitaconyl-CoA hydratase
VSIHYDVEGPVATITLDRPEAMNAMDTAAYADITEALRRLDADDAVRVGIVTGAGEQAFSAGADLKEMHAEPANGGPWRPWRPDRWDVGVPVGKPMIAAIDGYALAGGLELALKCDVRIATPRSQFGTPEVKWNLLHGYGALRLPGIVGMGNALMLLLTGDFIDAAEALRIGLVNAVVDPPELMERAVSIAQTIAVNAPDAVHMTKELALFGSDAPLEQYMRLYHSYMAQIDGNEEQLERTRSFAAPSASTEAAG